MTTEALAWLSVKENQELVVVIIAILGVIGTFVAWFFGLFKRSSGGGQSASGGSANIGGSVGGGVMTGGSKAEGGSATVGGNVGGNLTIGYTPEQHEIALQRRLDELRADLEAKQAALAKVAATEQELLRRDLDQLLRQKAEVERRQGDLDTSYSDAVAKIRELEALLAREGNLIGGDRLAEARAALEQGDFSKADDLFAEIEAREAMAVQSAARAAYGRGEIAEEQVRWADAAEHYGRAAKLEPTFEILEKAAQFAWRSGQFADAEHLVRQMLTAAHSAKSLDQEGLALNSLALLLKAQGSYDEAEPLIRQAMEIGEKTVGTAHPNYASGLNTLAGLLKDMGRFDEAEPLYRQALEITGNSLGTAHPAYANRLNNLAGLLKAMGRYDEAEPLYLQALEIVRAKLGSEHPNTKKVEANYATFLKERDVASE